MNKILEELSKTDNPKEQIELLLVLKAAKEFEVISKDFTVDKIDILLKKLEKDHKLFTLYTFPKSLFKNNEIQTLIEFLDDKKFPKVNECLFYLQNKEYLTSYEIGKLSIKLLREDRNKIDEIYLPYPTNFSISDFTDAKIYSESFNPYLEFIALLIKIIEKKELEYELTDILQTPTYINDDKSLKQFSYVVSFAPMNFYSDKTIEDKYNRFKYPIKKSLDVAFFENALSHTKEKAIVLMPMGFAFRSLIEKDFREYLVSNNYIDAIINLPSHLHSGTTIGSILLVIDKNRKEKDILFIELKDKNFVKKVSRKITLSNIDKIASIYHNKEEIKNISILVGQDLIAQNDYSFATDRYFINEKLVALQKSLEEYNLVKLSKIAEIKKSQQVKDEGEGFDFHELQQSDFCKSGYTTIASRARKNSSQITRINSYELKENDIVISVKGNAGKVAIIGDIKETIVAAQTLLIVRLNSKLYSKKDAIALYMFLKSQLGQTLLDSLKAGSNIAQIPTDSIKNLKIPKFNQEKIEQLNKKFIKEQELYKQIDELENQIKELHKHI